MHYQQRNVQSIREERARRDQNEFAIIECVDDGSTSTSMLEGVPEYNKVGPNTVCFLSIQLTCR